MLDTTPIVIKNNKELKICLKICIKINLLCPNRDSFYKEIAG